MKQILKFIEDNSERIVKGMTITELANYNYTSISSVFRLARKLGFKGYTDLVYALSNPDLDERLDHLDDQHIQDLSRGFLRLFQNNEETLNALVTENPPKKAVLVVGNGYSKIMADFLSMRFLAKGIQSSAISSSDTMQILRNNLKSLSHVFCVFKSGETSSVIVFLEFAKEHTIPIISFTQNESSTISKLSDYSFIIDKGPTQDWDNANATAYYSMLLLYFEVFIKNWLG